MRFVFIGAGNLSVTTAQRFLEDGNEVVIIETDEDRIARLSEEGLDCGFVHGDGTRPAVLKETSPENTDILFCLTDSDQTNIIASLVARTLEFPRVVTRVEDEEFEPVCAELGLRDTIVPDRSVAQSLVRLTKGEESPDLMGLAEAGVRFFSFRATEEDAGPLSELELGPQCRAMVIHRGSETVIVSADSEILEDDEVVLLAHESRLDELAERYGVSDGDDPDGD